MPCTTKRCSKCGEEKPVEAFNRYTRTSECRRKLCKACQAIQTKVWYERRVAHCRAVSRAYRDANNESLRSRDRAKRVRLRGVCLVYDARSRAKARGLTCDLDSTDIQHRVDAGFCEVTGCPFDLTPGSPAAPSLDRIDSTKGYTKDNVRVVAACINYFFGPWGKAAVLPFAKALVERNP